MRNIGLAIAAGLLFGCDDGSTPDQPFRCDGPSQCAAGFICDAESRTCVPDGGDLGMLPDVLRPDMSVDFGPPIDFGIPDVGEMIDAEPTDMFLDMGPPPCRSDPDPAPPPPEGLRDLVVGAELRVGGPLPARQFLPQDLDGAPDGAAEFVVARGGRAEALSADGRAWWSSPVLAISSIVTVVDLDGDGRQEVIASSPGAVFALDALTGALLWTSPEAPFGEGRAPLVSITRLLVTDATGDGLPDVYLTDGGCTGGGDGYGALFSFAAGMDAPEIVGRIIGPRVGGRCSGWQTIADLDDDGRPEVLRPDAVSIDTFDPTTGTRTLCGPIPDTAGDTRLPHFMFQLDDATRAIAVLDRDRALLMVPGDGPVAACPDDARSLQIRWQVPLGGTVEPAGSAAADLDGDGVTDLLTSVFAEGAWHIVGISGVDGAQLLSEPNTLLLGAVPAPDGPRLLTVEAPAQRPARFGDIQLRRLAGDRAPAVWPEPFALAAALTEPVRRTDRTPEFRRLLVLEDDGPRILLRQADPGGTRATRMLAVDLAGRAVARPLAGEPGGVHRSCGPAGCAPDRFGIALEDGALGIFSAQLALQNAAGARPAAAAPTGEVSLALASDGDRPVLVTLAASGVLGAANVSTRMPTLDWSVSLAAGRRNDPIGVGRRDGDADLLMVRDHTRDATGWRGIAADGRSLWLHVLDAASWRVEGGGVIVPDADGNAELALRFDRLTQIDAWRPDPVCARETVDPELFEPLPDCPNSPPTARVLTALDAETGLCRWRTALRPNRCGNPGNQNVSLVDADGDGVAEIYLTASNAIVRLDPETGVPEAPAVLGLIGGGGRGGGRFIPAADPPLIRYGGNGPVDAFDADFTLRWRAANPDGLRVQSWLGREALVTGDEVWVSPGPGLPIHRYALASAGEDVAPVGTVGLIEGGIGAPDIPSANVRSIQWVADAIDAGVAGVLVTANDGWLYALDLAGQLGWSQRFPATVGRVMVGDLDADGAREMAIPLSDGRVQIADLPGPPPPRAVWDLPCPAVPTCDPEADIDITSSTTTLCAEWIPVEGVVGYEVRVVDVNGAVISDWRDVHGQTLVRIGRQQLVPGARYAIQVRSTWETDGEVRRGNPRASDGVLVVNDAPPTIEVEVDPLAVDRNAGPVQITVRAQDDDLLAGWALTVRGPAGDIVQRLGGGPLAQPMFEISRDWNLEDREKELVPPGTYTIVGSVVDRGRNAGRAEVEIEICAGPCE